MTTKFTLTIDGIEHDLGVNEAGCSLKNWADVVCAYKRNDYGGVVRSFTSSFDFVNDAYDMLLALYLRDRYDAQAKLAVYTHDNEWAWVKRFECPLDFSTKSIANGVFSVKAVDDSLAALIKANKGTRYEMVVGTDIPDSGRFRFDRLPMIESATYALTMGDSLDDGSIDVEYRPPSDGSRMMWVGGIGDEVCVGRTIHWLDDQEDNKDSFLVEGYSATTVHVASEIELDSGHAQGAMDIILQHLGYDGQLLESVVLASVQPSPTDLGSYSTASDLQSSHPGEGYSTFDVDKYYALVGGIVHVIRYNGSVTYWYNTGRTHREYFGRVASVTADFEMDSRHRLRIVSSSVSTCKFRVFNSRIKLTWTATGIPCDIPTISPIDMANALLAKCADGKAEPTAQISAHDPRLARTRLLAAESARGIDGARIYSTFSEFATWMEVVFGYVYTIDGDVVRFVHRSELFGGNVVKVLDNASDVSNSTVASQIFATVEIGYDKKDYDKVNGRDEWNFSNEYSTGCHVSDKKLQLVSKYRCDCYGIEFAVQKREEETTDNTSDNDVFFVLCSSDAYLSGADRTSYPVAGALSDKVFNGAFSPMQCVLANAGYIGMQSEAMTLKFTSSKGNSDIVVDGMAMSGDIVLGCPLMMSETVTASTDDNELPSDMNGLVQFHSNGITYVGYVAEIDDKFAREESVKYKLLVKTMTI